MSVHLVGGGRDEGRSAEVFRPFVAEVRARTESPLIVLLLVVEPDDATSAARFGGVLASAGAPAGSVRTSAIAEGSVFPADVVEGADGIVVGGGLTPAYLDAMTDAAAAVRERVAAGGSYLGFSAGAAIAPVRALVGGFRLHGRVVCPEDAAEELDELTVRPGLGLIDDTVDVHAAQWGTLSRLVAAVGAGLTPGGVAIDEHTAMSIGVGGAEQTFGEGRVWRVDAPKGTLGVRVL